MESDLNIWVAASENNIDLVIKLINEGIYTSESKDSNGFSVIHAAASYGHISMLKFLVIDKKGNINIQDNDGDTPLHHVDDLETAKFLIEELKADYKIKNHDGLTAFEFINKDGEYPEIEEYSKSLNDTMNFSNDEDFKNLALAKKFFDNKISYSYKNINYDKLSDSTNSEQLDKNRDFITKLLDENGHPNSIDHIRNFVSKNIDKIKDTDESKSQKKKQKIP